MASAAGLQIDRAYVVAPVLRGYPLAEGVEVVPVEAIPAICALSVGSGKTL